jgi:hypothetical protein
MTTEPVPNRDCGSCNACCTHPCIVDRTFKKLPGVLCPHWAQSCGCTIYETRPGTCRGHYCGWRLLPQLDESWRPDKSNIYISVTPKRPEDLSGENPDGPQSFVFTVTGELSAKHLVELINIIRSLLEKNIPAVLRAAAPAGKLRLGLSLNPLLKPFAAKADTEFIEAFAQVLCASVDMPVTEEMVA